MDKSSIKEYTLRDYNVEFQSAYNKEGAKWWRETDTSKILESNGYFEYVGEGKGLYNINLDDLVDESKAGSDDHGIRYKIQAMERKGTEEPKGEWQVNEPAYFWAKSTSGSGYPTIHRLLLYQTDYNRSDPFFEYRHPASGICSRTDSVQCFRCGNKDNPFPDRGPAQSPDSRTDLQSPAGAGY